MKRLLSFSFLLMLISLSACRDTSKESSGNLKPRTHLDSLMDDVMDGHNVGMSKMGKLTRLEQQAQRMIDSLEKLPAKARQAAAPYKARLDSVLKDLKYADFAMNKWMEEFKMDSAVDDAKKQVEYLTGEKLKISTVKKAILNSLAKADSALTAKKP